MSKIVILFAALTICLVTALPVKAQFSDSSPSVKTVLSDKPFFNTPSVLTLTGDYVNSPREDFLQSGSYNLPLALDQMDGLVAGVTFGDNAQRGQWQLAYSRKLIVEGKCREIGQGERPELVPFPACCLCRTLAAAQDS